MLVVGTIYAKTLTIGSTSAARDWEDAYEIASHMIEAQGIQATDEVMEALKDDNEYYYEAPDHAESWNVQIFELGE